MRRALWPLSPPAITQWMQERSRFGRGPSRGSAADEADCCRDGTEVVDAEGVALGLDADAHPDVGGPVSLSASDARRFGALSEDLVRVPGGVGHDLKDALDEVQRHVGWKRSLMEFTKTTRGARHR